MKLLIQRVSRASVTIKQKVKAKIDTGFVVFLGIHTGDSQKDIEYCIKKLLNLRIFEDENQKMNKSIIDIEGDLLVISQFTLYGETKKGNRPSFTQAMKPDLAKKMYEKFLIELKAEYENSGAGGIIGTGEFGALMDVSLVNAGPVTILIGSRES